jgi:hypothetical protein
MGFFRGLKNLGGRILKVGGHAIKKISDIGGKVADYAGSKSHLANWAGLGISLAGAPELGSAVYKAGDAVRKAAYNENTRNVINAGKDVGNALIHSGNYLRNR